MKIFNTSGLQTVFNSDADGVSAAVNVEVIECDIVNIQITGTVFAQVTEWNFAMNSGTSAFENDIIERAVAYRIVTWTAETDTVAAAVEYAVGNGDLFTN